MVTKKKRKRRRRITIEQLLGKSMSDIVRICGNRIVHVNKANRMVEVKDIYHPFGNNYHEVMFYFDITNPEIMTVAIVKIRGFLLYTLLRHKSTKIKIKGYIGSVTIDNLFRGSLTFVKEDMLEVM